MLEETRGTQGLQAQNFKRQACNTMTARKRIARWNDSKYHGVLARDADERDTQDHEVDQDIIWTFGEPLLVPSKSPP